jgi:hypothetical protein
MLRITEHLETKECHMDFSMICEYCGVSFGFYNDTPANCYKCKNVIPSLKGLIKNKMLRLSFNKKVVICKHGITTLGASLICSTCKDIKTCKIKVY